MTKDENINIYYRPTAQYFSLDDIGFALTFHFGLGALA